MLLDFYAYSYGSFRKTLVSKNQCTMRAREDDILSNLNLPRGDAPSRRAINSEQNISVRASTTTKKRDCAIIAIYLSPTDLPRRQPP